MYLNAIPKGNLPILIQLAELEIKLNVNVTFISLSFITAEFAPTTVTKLVSRYCVKLNVCQFKPLSKFAKLSFNVLIPPVTVPSPIADMSVVPSSFIIYLKLLAILETFCIIDDSFSPVVSFGISHNAGSPSGPTSFDSYVTVFSATSPPTATAPISSDVKLTSPVLNSVSLSPFTPVTCDFCISDNACCACSL